MVSSLAYSRRNPQVSRGATTQRVMLDSEATSLIPNPSTFRSLTLELKQGSKFKEKQRRVRIFDNTILSVAEKTPKQRRSFMIHLALLDPTPKRIYNINMKLLTAFMVLEVLTYVAYVVKGLQLQFFSGYYIQTAIALLATSSVIMLLLTIKSFNNKWVFYTARGRIKILELFNNNPGRGQFQQVFGDLIDNINKIKSKNYFSNAKLAAAEVSEHRRLRDEGIITAEQYEQAKQNILYGEQL
ncbi:SHOCT domain-containing protein [Kaarinaea lacus]